MRTASPSLPAAGHTSRLWRRAIAALATATLAAGTIAATPAVSDGLATTRPNATLSNLGINVVLEPGLEPTVVADGWAVLFAVDEAADGRDRNGDGDSTDLVLHVLEIGSGSLAFDNVRNLGLALKPESMLVTGDEATAFVVAEAAQGADLNGDGDTDDHVLHTWDDRAGEVDSSGLAVAAERLPEPARPIGTATFTAVVPEAAQGADLNGDGDLDDDVLHVWEPRLAHRVTSTGRAYATYGLYGASGLPGYALLADGQLGFMVDEAADGRDANGDGDASDDLVHVVEPATATVRSLGLAAQGLHDGGPGLLVIEADEAATGRDLDGDGTVDGHPVLVSDGTVAGTAATGVQALPDYDVMAERVAPAGPGVVALVPFVEGAVGTDLLRYVVADGTLTDTGADTRGLIPAVDGHVAFMGRSAAGTGLHVLRPDGELLATGIDGHRVSALTDTLVAVDAASDLFGPDELVAVADVTTGAHWAPDLHLESWRARALADGRIGLRVVEHVDGPFHAMLDGDDVDGEGLPALWDPVAGHTRTLDVGSLASWPTGDGDAVVAVDEATTGDLDGDGDATDIVLVRARFGPLGDPSGPRLDVRAQEVAPGEVQLDVAASSADATPLIALGARLEGEPRAALTPTDGIYDAADETFAQLLAGSQGQTICIDALDADGHRSAICLPVEAPSDHAPPVVRDVVASPVVLHPGDDLRVEAVVDDSDTGGSAIADATLELGGATLTMTPSEPPADSAVEAYVASTTAPDAYGTHELCVVGTDVEANSSSPSCTTIEVRDLRGPAVTALGAAPDPVEEGEPLVLHATLDDALTGGSPIAEAVFSVDGTAVATQARDGALDSATEEVEAFLDHATGVGDRQLCVSARDTAGATTEQCTTFTVAAGEGPLVRDVVVAPATVGLDTPVTLSAVIDDTTTGGAFIAHASYDVDGEPVGLLFTDDYDEPVESVSADVPGFTTPGARTLCVTGYDRNNNASAEPGCVTLTVVDDVAPVISGLQVPGTVEVRAPFEVWVTADDRAGGNSAIAQVEAVLDGLHAVSLAAVDGSFDRPTELATATLPGIDEPGSHEVCVRATDAAGNVTSATCATVSVVDTLAPAVSDLILPSGPVVAGEPFTFTFTADDTATGGSAITAARATVAGGPGSVTTAPVDGALDGPREQMRGTVSGTQHLGVLQVCVHATDAHGNQAEPLCEFITVVGRSVVGGGSIPSSVSPLGEEASFDVDVRETADGLDGSFTYVDGAYSFVATTFTELRTDGSTVGHLSGRGTLFGLLTCDFSLTAHEGAYSGPAPGGLALTVSACGPVPGALYDSGPVKGLTSGSITVSGG